VVVGETAVIGNRVSLMHVSHPDPSLLLLFNARINLGTIMLVPGLIGCFVLLSSATSHSTNFPTLLRVFYFISMILAYSFSLIFMLFEVLLDKLL